MDQLRIESIRVQLSSLSFAQHLLPDDIIDKIDKITMLQIPTTQTEYNQKFVENYFDQKDTTLNF